MEGGRGAAATPPPPPSLPLAGSVTIMQRRQCIVRQVPPCPSPRLTFRETKSSCHGSGIFHSDPPTFNFFRSYPKTRPCKISDYKGMRSSRLWMRSSRVWMRSSRVVRASDSIAKVATVMDSIPASSDTMEFEGGAGEAVLKIVHT